MWKSVFPRSKTRSLINQTLWDLAGQVQALEYYSVPICMLETEEAYGVKHYLFCNNGEIK